MSSIIKITILFVYSMKIVRAEIKTAEDIVLKFERENSCRDYEKAHVHITAAIELFENALEDSKCDDFYVKHGQHHDDHHDDDHHDDDHHHGHRDHHHGHHRWGHHHDDDDIMHVTWSETGWESLHDVDPGGWYPDRRLHDGHGDHDVFDHKHPEKSVHVHRPTSNLIQSISLSGLKNKLCMLDEMETKKAVIEKGRNEWNLATRALLNVCPNTKCPEGCASGCVLAEVEYVNRDHETISVENKYMCTSCKKTHVTDVGRGAGYHEPGEVYKYWNDLYFKTIVSKTDTTPVVVCRPRKYLRNEEHVSMVDQIKHQMRRLDHMHRDLHADDDHLGSLMPEVQQGLEVLLELEKSKITCK